MVTRSTQTKRAPRARNIKRFALALLFGLSVGVSLLPAQTLAASQSSPAHIGVPQLFRPGVGDNPVNN